MKCVRGVCMGAQAVGCPRSLSSLSLWHGLWTEVQQGDKNSETAMAHTCSGCGGAVLSARGVPPQGRGFDAAWGRGPLSGPWASNGLPTGFQPEPKTHAPAARPETTLQLSHAPLSSEL